jgi:hypothetical protein
MGRPSNSAATKTIPIEHIDPSRAGFVPRHLRHAKADERGRLHVRAIDDEDTTFLPIEVQDYLRLAFEADDRERAAIMALRTGDARALQVWQAFVERHRPALAG